MARGLGVTYRRAHAGDLERLYAIDDEASALFASAGVDMSALTDEHPFVRAERARIKRALDAGLVELALDPDSAAIGFIASGFVDDKPYIEELAVVPSWMRRGVGGALLRNACANAASAGALWLTTYAHLPWNGPMYARAGFLAVPEHECGPGIREILREQREALPQPEQRIAMVRSFGREVI